MENENLPKQPSLRKVRREKTNRIAEIGHRIADLGTYISAPIRELGDKFIVLSDEIRASKKNTEALEKEYQQRSFTWLRKSTHWSVALSVLSLIPSVGALYLVKGQLKTMQIEQRAWMQVETKFEPPVENKPFVVTFNTKNIGKTPAKRIKAYFNVQIVNKDNSPNLNPQLGVNFAVGMMNPDLSVGAIVPLFKGSADLLHPPSITKTEVESLKSGETYLAFVAKVNYLDVFGNTHWFNFCYWHNTAIGNYNSRPCVEFNDDDN